MTYTWESPGEANGSAWYDDREHQYRAEPALMAAAEAAGDRQHGTE